METIRNKIDYFKNKFTGPKEKTRKTWETKTGSLSKELLNNLDNDFVNLTTEILETKIKFLGQTEGGGSILTPGLSEKELLSPKKIETTENGKSTYEHSPLYNFIKEAVDLSKNWKEKINNEKLAEKEKQALLNQLNFKKQNLVNQLYDIRHDVNLNDTKKQVLKKVKILKAGISQEMSNELSTDLYIEKIQQLAENYNQEENSDDSIRQAVNYVGKISKKEDLEPKKLINDLLDIFGGNAKKENIVNFYKQLSTFFEAVEKIKSDPDREENTKIIDNPPILNT